MTYLCNKIDKGTEPPQKKHAPGTETRLFAEFRCRIGHILVRFILFLWTIHRLPNYAITSFGYDQGMMGGVNTAPHYVETMKLGYSTYEGPSEGYVVTITEPTRQGGIVSSKPHDRPSLSGLKFSNILFFSFGTVYYLGTLVGCLAGGIIGDRVGRLRTMLIGGLWVLLGATLQCSAQNIAWWVRHSVVKLQEVLQIISLIQDALRASDKWDRNWPSQCNRACVECRGSYTYIQGSFHRFRVHPQYLWRRRCLLA